MCSKQDIQCSKEFESIKLGNKRLNRRLLKVANDLLNNPTKAIHNASNGWAQAKAAYRLFDNDKLTEDSLMQAENPPSVREAVRVIVKLGGFLERKNDKEPGITYIWRGWEKLTLIAEFWHSITNVTCG